VQAHGKACAHHPQREEKKVGDCAEEELIATLGALEARFDGDFGHPHDQDGFEWKTL
jgi:hypothetical protein